VEFIKSNTYVTKLKKKISYEEKRLKKKKGYIYKFEE